MVPTTGVRNLAVAPVVSVGLLPGLLLLAVGIRMPIVSG
jgi:hypothetical protein